MMNKNKEIPFIFQKQIFYTNSKKSLVSFKGKRSPENCR